jgi:hypothetical protein
MADTWGGIARAMEEGISRNEAAAAREEMYPGHLEAARDANAHGIIGLLSGRHKAFVESNKAQMRELGINPSHRNEAGKLTGRYSSGDWKALQDALAGGQAVTTGLGPDNSPVATPIGDPSLWGDSPKKNTIDNVNLHPDFMARATPGEIDYELAVARGEVDYDKSGMPGLGAARSARRERAMRNMSRRDREAAGLGNLERFDEFGRISGQFDERMGRMKDKLRDWDIEDRTRRPGIMGGGPSTRIQPNWAALEEDMARRAMAESFIGRDER